MSQHDFFGLPHPDPAAGVYSHLPQTERPVIVVALTVVGCFALDFWFFFSLHPSMWGALAFVLVQVLAGVGFIQAWFRFRWRKVLEEIAGFLKRSDRPAASEAVERRLGEFWPEQMRSTLLVILADERLAVGRVAEAAALYGSALRLDAAPALSTHMALGVMNSFAMLGRIDESAAWRRLLESKASVSSALTLRARTLEALRRETPEMALGVLDRELPEAERELSGAMLRQLRLLRAFALDATGRPADAESELLSLAPLAPGEFAGLSRSWNGLESFLAAQGWGAAAGQAQTRGDASSTA